MRSYWAASFLCSLLLWPVVARAEGPFAPPPGRTLLLVGQDRETIARYVGATHSIPGGLMIYTSIQKVDGLDSRADYGAGWQDGSWLLRRYPDSTIQLGLYMVGALEDVNNGKYDGNIIKLAEWIKATGRPVYLRIGYEFDNPVNHYDPQEYREAYRHIVDGIREQGVTNVAYVWHSWDSGYLGQARMKWYPGDEYVDWFAVSLFQTQQLPQAGEFLDEARQRHKPFMIAESTPWGLYGLQDEINWFAHVFTFIEQNDVEAFCYINSEWDDLPMYRGQFIGNASIYRDGRLKELWLQAIKGSRYLKASPDLFALLGYE